MKIMLWLIMAGFVVAAGWLVVHARRKLQERERSEAERFAAFMTATAGAKKPAQEDATEAPAPAPIPAVAMQGDGLPQQKLLFDAAHKAGEAGGPALAIQLYARLLARYPATTFVAHARAAVEAQKKKLSKA